MNWIQFASLSFMAKGRAAAERDLAGAGGLVFADHMVHVAAHVVRWRVHVGAGNGDVVASGELDVRVAEGVLGQVVERFEPSCQHEVGMVELEVGLVERRLGQRGEVPAVEAVEVGGGPPRCPCLSNPS